MSLNCLITCQETQRTNSDKDIVHEKRYGKICCINIERSWSGNLSPQPYEKIRSGSMMIATKKVKKGHCRLNSTGAVAFEGSGGPRLVRSCGMRRDWSFEDLREREKKRKGERVY